MNFWSVVPSLCCSKAVITRQN